MKNNVRSIKSIQFKTDNLNTNGNNKEVLHHIKDKSEVGRLKRNEVKIKTVYRKE